MKGQLIKEIKFDRSNLFILMQSEQYTALDILILS